MLEILVRTCSYIPLVAVYLGTDNVVFPPGQSVNSDRECGQVVVAVTVHSICVSKCVSEVCE